MKFITLICAGLLLAFNLYAQIYFDEEANNIIEGAQKVRLEKGQLTYLRLAEANYISIETHRDWVADVFNFEEGISLQLNRTENDKWGNTHHCYHVYYHGVRVLGAYLNVHSENGLVYAANGALFCMPEHRTPEIEEETAINEAINYIAAEVYSWDEKPENYPESELLYVPLNFDFEQADFKLVHAVKVRSYEPYQAREIYVSASNGELIASQNLLRFADEEGVAFTTYSGKRNIITEKVGDQYRLRESGRGEGIRTFNCNGSTDITTALDVYDNNNIWEELNIQWNFDHLPIDAHWGAEMTYDYFSEVFDRNSLDDNGLIIYSFTEHGSIFQEAFWDTEEVCVKYNTIQENQSFFNRGTPVSLNKCGHELSHGLTQYTADLLYTGESGALNESFSDIFAYCIEAYTMPESVNWLIGEELLINDFKRSMNNPHLKFDAKFYMGNYWQDTNDLDNDEGGIHSNSGVQNHWFYLLVNGDSGLNENDHYYKVSSIGLEAAEAIVYYSLTNYLGESSDFDDAVFYSLEATAELYGECSFEYQQVQNAWFTVGLLEEANFPTISIKANNIFFCDSLYEVQFELLSPSSTNPSWDFGDGNSSTELNPINTYEKGVYTISLTADHNNCEGVSETINLTINEQIILGAWGATNFPIPIYNSYNAPIENEVELYDCYGVLYDHAGPSPYIENANSDIFFPYNQDDFGIYFESFELNNNSALRVYNGSTIADSTLVGIFNFDSLSGDTLFLDNETAILEWNIFSAANGFKSFWWTNESEPLKANFSANRISCDGIVEFNNTSLGNTNNWQWDLGDGNIVYGSNPIHEYTEDGTYDIQLIACNDYSCDTLIKKAYISVSLDCEEAQFHELPETSDNENTYINNCMGIITDNISESSNQPYDEYLIIEVPGAEQIELNFHSFNYGFYSYLSIYDGPDLYSPLLGYFTGDELPNGGTILSSGNSITIKEDLEYASLNTFELSYRAIGATINSAFSVADSIPINFEFTLENNSTATEFEWDFGDGNTSNERNPTHTYNLPGQYDITLTASNCALSEVSTQTVQVVESSNGFIVSPASVALTLPNNSDSTVLITINNFDDLPLGVTIDSSTLPFWLSISNSSFPSIVDANSESTFEFNFNTSIVPGTYNINVVLYNSSTVNPSPIIPVSIEVVLKPNAQFSVDENNSCYGIFSFYDESNNNPTNWLWDFGDGNTSTEQNPIHTYEEEGVYTVELLACNFVGCDNLIIDDITYDYSSPICSIFDLPTSGNISTEKCPGELSDSGGQSSYSNNSNASFTIQPIWAGNIGLFFESFNLQTNDSLSVYDGQDTLGIFLGKYSTQELANKRLLCSSGAAHLVFKSDESGIAEGFKLNWECNVDPLSSIFIPPYDPCVGEVEFINQSFYASEYYWDFGNGITSSEFQPSNIQYLDNGGYEVHLISCNNLSCDTLLIPESEVSINFDCYNDIDNLPSTPIPDEGNLLVTDCIGYIIDETNGQYGENTGSLTIELAEGTQIDLTFLHFHFNEENSLSIYDGPDTNSPLIGTYTGIELPEGGNIISTGNTLTFVENDIINQNDFTVLYQAVNPDLFLQLDFEIPDFIIANYPASFTNNSLAEHYIWNWGDGTISFDEDTIHSFPESGQYDVALIAYACGFSDTLTQNIEVLSGSENFELDADSIFITLVLGEDTTTNFTINNLEDKFLGLNFDYPDLPNWFSAEVFGSYLIQANETVEFIFSLNTDSIEVGVYEYNLPINNTFNDEDTFMTITLEVVNQPFADFSVDDSYLCDELVNFTDESINTPTLWLWDFGDGNTSEEQNPSHTYNEYGNFTITLITCNDIGCDTLIQENLIYNGDVSQSYCNEFNFPEDESMILANKCAGTIYDSGGPNDNYNNGTVGLVLVDPPGNGNVILTFEEFHLNCCDYFYIFDGPTSSSPLIGSYNYEQLEGQIIETEQEVVLLAFSTSPTNTETGFKIIYESDQTIEEPNADFVINDHISVGIPVLLENQSYMASNYYWDLGDGSFSLEENPIHTYTSVGEYEVSLIVENCYGTDTSAIQTIQVGDSPTINLINNEIIIELNSGESIDTNLLFSNIGIEDLIYHTYLPNFLGNTTNFQHYILGLHPSSSHQFGNLNSGFIDSILLTTTINGDFNETLEFAYVEAYGNTINTLNINEENGTDIIESILLDNSILSNIALNDTLSITIDNNLQVNVTETDYHIVDIDVYGHEWLRITDNSNGVLSEGEENSIPLVFDATNLHEGVYETTIQVHSNDMDQTNLNIPMQLIVNGQAELQLSENEINFGDLQINTSISQSVQISNTGTANLLIENVELSNNNFATDFTPMVIPPNTNQTFDIDFSPYEILNFEEELLIESNAGDFSISLSGQGIGWPITNYAPQNLEIFLLENVDSTFSINFENLGEGPLELSLLLQENEDIPEWLTFDNQNIIIEANNSANITLHINTDSTSVDSYIYFLHINTNDLNQNTINYPINLTVASIPLANFEVDYINLCDKYIRLTDLSEYTVDEWYWDLGDGSTFTDQNPYYMYEQNGVYDINLLVCNQYGCDSTSMTINIEEDDNTDCNAFAFVDEVSITINSCSGYITDDGGLNNDYSSNMNSEIILNNINGASIKLYFEEFKTQGCCDSLRIYNGDTIPENLLYTFSGFNIPEDTLLYHGSQLRFLFNTNHFFQESGFKLHYQCLDNVAIENQSNLNYSIYPNPNNGNFQIQLSKAQEVSIDLFDINGRKVYQNTYEAKEQMIDVNSQLPTGIYYLEIKNKEQIYREKIMISD